ncbi:MAG: HAD family hydrolase [Alphaproteobacteria bacterium]|nr:HAD family hydrolase [Alphaproteobacteria bacterium]
MRLIIFDVDGTLVDSQNFIVEAQKRAFLSLGMQPATRERALSIVGLSLDEAFTQLMDGDASKAPALSNAYRQAWQVMRHEPGYEDALYEGAKQAVEHLARQPNTMLGIATGKSVRGVQHLFDQCGWHDLFVTVQTSDHNPSKPAPDMILRALEETGIDPAATVMIGDTSFDMAMARSAGVNAIGVSWGYHPHEDLRAAGAKIIVDSFADLLHQLDLHHA